MHDINRMILGIRRKFIKIGHKITIIAFRSLCVDTLLLAEEVYFEHR